MKAPVGFIVALSATVYAVWLVLSGHYTGFLLAVGAVCTALVVYVALRMEVVDEEGVPFVHLGPKLLAYIPWFMLEIVKSNLEVTRVILQPKMPINPRLFTVRGQQRTDLGRVIFANSITLTPGTITVEAAPGKLVVHALDGASGEDLVEGALERKVGEVFTAKRGTR